MTTKHELTCRFFELMLLSDGEQLRFDPADWTTVLQKYGKRSYAKRRVEFENGIHVIEPRHSTPRALAIHRLKDENEFLSRVTTDGRVSEVMAVDEDGAALADTSCVVFAPDSNVFGLVRSNRDSPLANKVAEWLGEQKVFGDKHFAVRPLVLPADAGWRGSMDGATKVSVDVPVTVLDELAAHLGGAERTFADDLPDAHVTLTLTYGRRRPSSVGGRGMLKVAEFFADKAAGVNSKVSASATASVYQEVVTRPNQRRPDKSKTKLVRETVALVEYDIASKIELPEVSEGEVRIDLTLQRMEAARLQHADELARAQRTGGNDGEDAS